MFHIYSYLILDTVINWSFLTAYIQSEVTQMIEYIIWLAKKFVWIIL